MSFSSLYKKNKDARIRSTNTVTRIVQVEILSQDPLGSCMLGIGTLVRTLSKGCILPRNWN